LASVIRELRPTLGNLDPFLANLNPVVSWLNYYRSNITDFLSNPPAGLSGQLTPQPGQPAPRHVLKQLGYITQESLAVYPNRLPENRGNGYLAPYGDIIKQGSASRFGIFPNFDEPNPPGGILGTPHAFAPCFVAPPFKDEFGGTQFPQVSKAP